MENRCSFRDDVEEIMTGDSDQMSVEAVTELLNDSL